MSKVGKQTPCSFVATHSRNGKVVSTKKFTQSDDGFSGEDISRSEAESFGRKPVAK